MAPTPAPLPILPNGIESIALSFSGGGFRAAAFTLGCISYLNQVEYDNAPLLHKVKFISSASGGSITNLLVCSMLRTGSTFEEIYAHQKDVMSGCKLMDEVFRVLADPKEWTPRPKKHKNLINAFAIAYENLLFKGTTFHDLHRSSRKGKFVIAETCIDATEFDNGMNFRWCTGGLIGNNYLFLAKNKTVANKIKLSDILATSSCFPAGFEPVMFPDDLTYTGSSASLTEQELDEAITEIDHYNGKQTSASEKNEKITFGIMDGGIDDNQGIYAFQLANNRKGGNFDLYFPCDVSSNYLDAPFEYPPINKREDLKQSPAQLEKKIKNQVAIYYGILIVGLIASIVLTFKLPELNTYWLILCGIFAAGILLPIIAYTFIKSKVKSFMPQKKEGNSWGAVFDKYKLQLLKLPLSTLLAMGKARLDSVLLLSSTVYLKRIRQVSYTLLYASQSNKVYSQLINANNKLVTPGVITPGALWDNHIAASTVYLLATKNDFMLQQILKKAKLPKAVHDELHPVPPEIRKACDIAAAMETTLWFDDEQVKNQSMKNLIMAGQATMCFNLILTSYRFANSGKDWMDLRASLWADWAKFGKEMDWMY